MNLITYIVLLLVVNLVKSQSCDINYVEMPVKDTERGLFVVIRTDENVEGIVKNHNSFSSYYEIVHVNDYNYNLVPTKDFENYETEQTEGVMEFLVMVYCSDGKSFEKAIHQIIEDTNNHAPAFSQDNYLFKLPMPFPEGSDISPYGSIEIKATDFDLTNRNITFLISPPYDFAVETYRDENNNRTFVAKIHSKIVLKLDKTTEYVISATDAGSPTKSSAAIITIETVEGPCTPNINFEDAYYRVRYGFDNSGHSFLFLYKGMKIFGDSLELIELSLNPSDIYSHYFTVRLTAETNVVDFFIKINLPNSVLEKEKYIPLTMLAKYQNETVARAAVFIELPLLKK